MRVDNFTILGMWHIGRPKSHLGFLRVLARIRLGEQSIKDDDVLSEKINFSAPGGPESAPFDTDDDDPLYFEVSIVSAPPDPPYMSKNAKMCYFHHFLRVPKKTYPLSTGLP